MQGTWEKGHALSLFAAQKQWAECFVVRRHSTIAVWFLFSWRRLGALKAGLHTDLFSLLSHLLSHPSAPRTKGLLAQHFTSAFQTKLQSSTEAYSQFALEVWSTELSEAFQITGIVVSKVRSRSVHYTPIPQLASLPKIAAITSKDWLNQIQAIQTGTSFSISLWPNILGQSFTWWNRNRKRII